jgi:hypothetical protein
LLEQAPKTRFPEIGSKEFEFEFEFELTNAGLGVMGTLTAKSPNLTTAELS